MHASTWNRLQSLVVVLLLASCAHESHVSPPAATAQPRVAEPSALDKLKDRIGAGEFANVHALLVMRGGEAIAEWYFAGQDERRGAPSGSVSFDAAALHDVRSISKSVVGLLFGVAHATGAIKSLDEPVLNYFPEYRKLATPERSRIRLRDLLSMTAGLQWDEDSVPYTDPRNSETAMDLAVDRYQYVLEQPIVSPPGERFRYSGGNVAVLGEVLRRATTLPIDIYAERVLFKPLGVTQYEWLKDSHGTPFAASGLRLRPLDMAKIGLLVQRQGNWGQHSIVPKAWLETATSAHAQVAGDADCGIRYGYLWWLGTKCGEHGSRTQWVAAIGNGGQRIVIVPSLDLVLVVTAGMYNDPSQGKYTTALLDAASEAAIPKQ